ncbi:MAG: hypothetical protein V1738_06810 [Patescibacteria group bacterium]
MVRLFAMTDVLFSLSLSAYVSNSEVISAAEANGYSDVRVVAEHLITSEFYGCHGESTAFEMTGVRQGRREQIIMCCESDLFLVRCYSPIFVRR